jgi:hypothetical protein
MGWFLCDKCNKTIHGATKDWHEKTLTEHQAVANNVEYPDKVVVNIQQTAATIFFLLRPPPRQKEGCRGYQPCLYLTHERLEGKNRKGNRKALTS